MTTGEDGLYRFDALPEGAEYASLPGAQTVRRWRAEQGSLSGRTVTTTRCQPLILDGGPPQILSITPPPGMEDVSRTAKSRSSSRSRFSTALSRPDNHVTILRAPRSERPCRRFVDVAGRSRRAGGPVHTVRAVRQPFDLQPQNPGGSSGVKDRAGRPLSERGDVGSNFKTSDKIGPAILGYVPDLDRPVEARLLSGLISTRPWSLPMNNSMASGMTMRRLSTGDRVSVVESMWETLPVSMFLTRNNYSLTVDPPDNFVLHRRHPVAPACDYRTRGLAGQRDGARGEALPNPRCQPTDHRRSAGAAECRRWEARSGTPTP